MIVIAAVNDERQLLDLVVIVVDCGSGDGSC